MSSLRQRLKNPATYLVGIVLILALATIDSFRAGEDQITARLYIQAVETYQEHGRQALASHIRCRYRPTCSEYSREAVRRHGIVGGIHLTAKRLLSCTREVKLGTLDSVPAAYR